MFFLGKHRSRYFFLVKAAKCYLSVYSSKKPLEHEISSKYCTIVATSRKSNGNGCTIVPYKFVQHLIVFEQMTTPKNVQYIVLRRYHWPEPTVHTTECSPKDIPRFSRGYFLKWATYFMLSKDKTMLTT